MKKQYKYLIAALAVLIVAVVGYSLTKSSKVQKVEKTPYGISQVAVYFYPSINKSNQPEFYDDITLSIGNTTGWSDTDRRIKKASFENIKVIKEPKSGVYNFFKPTNNPAKPVNTETVSPYNITNARRYDITVLPGNINANFNPDSIGQLGGLVHLYYYSNGFKATAKPAKDFAAAMKELGINNNDLKSKVAFDLQVTNVKDQTFIKHFEFDLPTSDINNSKTYSDSKMYDVDKNMFVKK